MAIKRAGYDPARPRIFFLTDDKGAQGAGQYDKASTRIVTQYYGGQMSKGPSDEMLGALQGRYEAMGMLDALRWLAGG